MVGSGQQWWLQEDSVVCFPQKIIIVHYKRIPLHDFRTYAPKDIVLLPGSIPGNLSGTYTPKEKFSGK